MRKLHRQLELKEVSEDQGSFTGLASVYNVVDKGGEVVMPGAFTKSLSRSGGRLPLFYAHRVNVGTANCEDSSEGLLTKGFLNLRKQFAKDVHSDLLHYKEHQVAFGMSIGYLMDAANRRKKGNVIELHEVDLFEVTLTEFPMNTSAQVIDVKDFLEELDASMLWSQRYQMISALDAALYDVLWDDKQTPEQKVAASEESIQQFSDAYLAYIPRFLAMLTGEKRIGEFEVKNGRALALHYKERVEALRKELEGFLTGKPASDEAARRLLAVAQTVTKGVFEWTSKN